MIDDSEQSYVDILELYTTLLQNWISTAIARQRRSTTNGFQNQPRFEGDIPLPSLIIITKLMYLASETLDPLIAHSSILVLRMLAINHSITVQTMINQYLQTLAQMVSLTAQFTSLPLSIPQPIITYLTFFQSPTVYSLSAATSMLSSYKEALERRLASQQPLGPNTKVLRERINEFNGYVMDACNLFWRGRAFNTADKNALGCLLPAEVFDGLERYTGSIRVEPRYTLASLFSLSFHPALAALSIEVLRNVEDREIAARSEDGEDAITERHAGPVTQRSLTLLARDGGVELSWAEYRLQVLNFCARLGAGGLNDLIRRSIKVQS
jgi:centromere protein I